MSLKAKKISSLEAGTYRAVCCWVVDLGMQYNKFTETDNQQILVGWELPDERVEIDGEDKPRVISRMFKNSLHPKANFGKCVRAWLGKEFDEASFDASELIGRQCQVQVEVVDRNGSLYSNVTAVVAPMKGAVPIVGEVPPVVYDMDSGEPIPSTLPEWIRNIASSSKDYQKSEKAPF